MISVVTPTYSWVDGCRIKLDVDAAGEAIEKVRAKYNGDNFTRNVLVAAESKRSPLHKYFDWTDTVAAEKWRLAQAGHLIRSIEIIVAEKPDIGPTRAFVSVGKLRFSTIRAVMCNEVDRDYVLGRALNELRNIQRKYAQLEELGPVFQAITEVLEADVPEVSNSRKRRKPRTKRANVEVLADA